MNEEERADYADELYEQVEAEKPPGFFERLAAHLMKLPM